MPIVAGKIVCAYGGGGNNMCLWWRGENSMCLWEQVSIMTYAYGGGKIVCAYGGKCLLQHMLWWRRK